MQFLATTLALAPLAMAASISTRQSECASTHIFLAKGNNEPYPGRQGVLVNAICSGLDSCDYEDILFYNPVDAAYCESVNQGVADGIQQITAYNARCPDSKLVVSGYSQGAQIVSDILGGGGGVFFQNCVQDQNAGLDINSAPGNKIAAALVFGNTRHTAGQPYNVLSGVNDNGIFPRTGSQLAGLLSWTSKFHDYCVHSDPVCAGGDTVANHLNYFDIYTNEAAAWVKSMLSSAPASTTVVPTSTLAPAVSASATGYPTFTGYTNGSSASTISSILAIPTVTLTYKVTVPCVTANTASLTAYSTFPVTAKPTTYAAGATTTAKPVTSVTGGNYTAPSTTATFLSSNGAGSSQASFGLFGLVAGALAMLL